MAIARDETVLNNPEVMVTAIRALNRVVPEEVIPKPREEISTAATAPDVTIEFLFTTFRHVFSSKLGIDKPRA